MFSEKQIEIMKVMSQYESPWNDEAIDRFRQICGCPGCQETALAKQIVASLDQGDEVSMVTGEPV